MAEYILAHDLGTSGNKATLFGTDGCMKGSCTYAYEVAYDQPLWAEQDAGDWWKAVCNSTRELLQKSHVSADEVKAVSFSGQMMGCLPVDKRGIPLRKAIIWADQRAQKQSKALSEKIDDERFYRINGHRNTASYGIQKAMWIRENQPEIYEDTYKFLNAKDYIVFRLTGKFYTDCSDANSMDCFDLAKRQWSEEIVQASGIDMDKLPEIVESVHYVGNVTEEAAALTGLSTGTKVIMGAGDGVAANVGAGCVAPGKAYCCMGTSAWVAGTSEKPVLDDNRRIVCWAHAVPGMYSPNGTMQYAGGSYKWMKDTICHEEARLAAEQGCSAYDIINERIASCAPGADGLIFLPYLLGERAPRWNPDAKGVFFGLTATTSREQILRSVMEGIVMNLGICFDILRSQTPIEEILLIGGAARSSQWRRGIADIFDTRVCVPEHLEEANSMGAAVIAGVGSGIYKDFSAIDRFIRVREALEPDRENVETYRMVRQKFEQVYQTLLPLFV
jgi:xylulokinase